MSRGLSTAVKTQLASGSFVMAHLVKLELNSTYYYTDFSSDIVELVPYTGNGIVSINEDAGEYKFVDISHGLTNSQIIRISGDALVGIDTNTNYYVNVVNVHEFKVSPTMDGANVAYNSSGIGGSYSGIWAYINQAEPDATYYWDNGTLIYNGGTYSANGFLTSLSGFSETSTMNIGMMNVALSAVNQTIVSDVLNNGHLHRAVTIKRAILDNSYAVTGSFIIYSGFIEGMSIRDVEGTSAIGFSVANHWADFERREGRHTNDSSHQHFFPNDKSFEFSPQAGKKLIWGHIKIDARRPSPPSDWQEGDPYIR